MRQALLGVVVVCAGVMGLALYYTAPVSKLVLYAAIACIWAPPFMFAFERRHSLALGFSIAAGLLTRLAIVMKDPAESYLATDAMRQMRLLELIGEQGSWSPGMGTDTRIQIYSNYPGLHFWALSVLQTTGLDIVSFSQWTFSVITIVLPILLIFVLYRLMLPEMKDVSLAVVLALANVQLLFTEKQFSYESIAIPLILTALVMLMIPGLGSRIAFVVTVAALIITHHFSSYQLLLAIGLLASAGIIFMVKGRLRGLLTPVRGAQVHISAFWLAGAMVLAYLAFVAYNFFAQTAKYAEASLIGLVTPLGEHYGVSGGFVGFSIDEVILIYAGLAVIALLAAARLWKALRGRTIEFDAAIGAGGLLYLFFFLAYFTSGINSDIRHRAWFLGLLLAAPALAVGLRYVANALPRTRTWVPRSAGAVLFVLLVLSTILLPGKVGYLHEEHGVSFAAWIPSARWMHDHLPPFAPTVSPPLLDDVVVSFGGDRTEVGRVFGGQRYFERTLPYLVYGSNTPYFAKLDPAYLVIDQHITETARRYPFQYALASRDLPNASLSGSIYGWTDRAAVTATYDDGYVRVLRIDAGKQ